MDQVRKAADALAGAGSSKARTSMEMATGGTRVTIRGEGGYDFKRRMGRLRKVRHQFSFASEGRAAAVTSTTLLYDFGVPVSVCLPDERDIHAGKIRT
jgi:hypothetical protein